MSVAMSAVERINVFEIQFADRLSRSEESNITKYETGSSIAPPCCYREYR